MTEDDAREHYVPPGSARGGEVLSISVSSHDEGFFRECDLRCDASLGERWDEESRPNGRLAGSLHQGNPSFP
jgi:hypothetical protein